MIFGTRPELIKLAPIIAAFEKRNLRSRLFILHTRQHDELVIADLLGFGIVPDAQLDWHRTGNSLSEMTGTMMILLDKFWPQGIQHFKAIIAQGDTCSTYCASLFAFYNHVPFIHIEAGLRTNDLNDPFPEEYYRKAISLIAAIHFAPTNTDKIHLLQEGIPEDKIFVTGNTQIDHLLQVKRRDNIQNVVIITMHRRENQQGYIQHFFSMLLRLAENYPLLEFIWIRHPGVCMDLEGYAISANLTFHPHVSFHEMLNLYQKTCMVFTDSGGMQEEAAYLGIPVVLLRKKTERMEGIKDGIFEIAHHALFELDEIVERLLKLKLEFPNNLYGDGYASQRILHIIYQKFETCFTPSSAFEMISE